MLWRSLMFMFLGAEVLAVSAGAEPREQVPGREIDPGRSLSAAPAPALKTKDLGRAGSLDDFLTAVVPGWPGWSRRYWTDKELWGNQGYIIGGPGRRLDFAGGYPEMSISPGESEFLASSDLPLGIPFEPVDLGIEKLKPGTHTVVKGECLWFIAGYPRIYGNPLQWPIIYKANRDRIKHPDLIYPGQVFVIPRD